MPKRIGGISMYCNRCGQPIETTAAFCSKCGAAQSSNASSQAPTGSPFGTASGEGAGAAYTRSDYQPGQAAPRPAVTAAATEQVPSVTSQVVLSIVNIVTFGFGISAILGIIALVFTLIASSATVPQEARTKLQAARTLNIIGLAIVFLQILVIIAVFIGLFGAIVAGLAN